MKILNGCTRKVFLIGRYAIKIPQVSYQWRHFLQGLLANMQEKLFSDMNDSRCCPVRFTCKGGWFIVMPRCTPITEVEFNELDIREFHPIEVITDSIGRDVIITSTEDDFNIPVEIKRCSFGWYKGKIVAIDYGS